MGKIYLGIYKRRVVSTTCIEYVIPFFRVARVSLAEALILIDVGTLFIARKVEQERPLPSSAAREAKMVAFKTAEKAQTGESDPILTRLANEDKVPWYRKRNLRLLYLLLFPACMGIELTSGFDSQLINALQLVPSWISCEFVSRAQN